MPKVNAQAVQQLRRNIKSISLKTTAKEKNAALREIRKIFKYIRDTYSNYLFELDNIVNELPLHDPKYMDRIVLELRFTNILADADLHFYVGWRNYRTEDKIRIASCNCASQKKCVKCKGLHIRFLKARKGKAKEAVKVSYKEYFADQVLKEQKQKHLRRLNAPWSM